MNNDLVCRTGSVELENRSVAPQQMANPDDEWSFDHLKVDATPLELPAVRPRSGGFVYFIGGDFDTMKIGWTRDPAKRLRALQTGSPVRLYLVAVIRGDRSLERQYHERFRSSWSHGEWFTKTPELIGHANDLSETAVSAKHRALCR